MNKKLKKVLYWIKKKVLIKPETVVLLIFLHEKK